MTRFCFFVLLFNLWFFQSINLYNEKQKGFYFFLRELILTVCSCHVMYAFQSESTLYSCLNVKELLAQSWCEIWSLSDCNWTRTQNHLVHKPTLNHLAKFNHLPKWLSVRLRIKWFWVWVQLGANLIGFFCLPSSLVLIFLPRLNIYVDDF